MSPSLSNDDAPAIPGALERTPGPSRRRSAAPRAVESNLVAHARCELRILGEDRDTIRGLCKVVQAFADMGHSGGSAPHAIAYLERLLRFQPLTDLTDDPAEWIDRHAEGMTPLPLWQSNRNSEAFSTDGGKTYYLLSEQQAAGDIATTPLHHSQNVPQPAEAEEA
ncbi:hypothetical protein [Streptomyces anulatus]|uniref:hypothetical protein n=1 Tax=Streptomyces anulatus TaxID=1892 RepID=UPI002E12B589|nr:hypothetical protein OG557_39010 [Streptomyces anulatus]